MIWNEDCLASMSRMEDKSVDLIVTSPPYNIGKSYNSHKDNRDDYLNWLSVRLVEMCRVSKTMWINLGYRKLAQGNIPISFQVYNDIVSCDMYLMQHIVWEYGAGMTYKSRFNHRKEDWLWFVSDKKNYVFKPDDVRDIELTKYKNDKRNNPNGKLPSDVWYFPHVAGNFKERKEHPAMFPQKMIERIILACSNKGDIVYDPFGGSGTVLYVSQSLGRSGITSEIDSKYCKIIEQRFLH